MCTTWLSVRWGCCDGQAHGRRGADHIELRQAEGGYFAHECAPQLRRADETAAALWNAGAGSSLPWPASVATGWGSFAVTRKKAASQDMTNMWLYSSFARPINDGVCANHHGGHQVTRGRCSLSQERAVCHDQQCAHDCESSGGEGIECSTQWLVLSQSADEEQCTRLRMAWRRSLELLQTTTEIESGPWTHDRTHMKLDRSSWTKTMDPLPMTRER